jgi:hypothetical protein
LTSAIRLATLESRDKHACCPHPRPGSRCLSSRGRRNRLFSSAAAAWGHRWSAARPAQATLNHGARHGLEVKANAHAEGEGRHGARVASRGLGGPTMTRRAFRGAGAGHGRSQALGMGWAGLGMDGQAWDGLGKRSAAPAAPILPHAAWHHACMRMHVHSSMHSNPPPPTPTPTGAASASSASTGLPNWPLLPSCSWSTSSSGQVRARSAVLRGARCMHGVEALGTATQVHAGDVYAYHPSTHPTPSTCRRGGGPWMARQASLRAISCTRARRGAAAAVAGEST